MSIFIINNYAKTKFHYNTQHIDQVKPKYEGGASAPKAPPGSAPVLIIKFIFMVLKIFSNAKFFFFTAVV